MAYVEGVREVGKISWVGWTAGMVAMAVFMLDTGQPLQWNTVMYITAGFALLAAGSAAAIKLHEIFASHFTP